jgi:hypothetical protein
MNVLEVQNNKPITLERFPGLEGSYDGINGTLEEAGSPFRVATRDGEFYLVRPLFL